MDADQFSKLCGEVLNDHMPAVHDGIVIVNPAKYNHFKLVKPDGTEVSVVVSVNVFFDGAPKVIRHESYHIEGLTDLEVSRRMAIQRLKDRPFRATVVHHHESTVSCLDRMHDVYAADQVQADAMHIDRSWKLTTLADLA